VYSNVVHLCTYGMRHWCLNSKLVLCVYQQRCLSFKTLCFDTNCYHKSCVKSHSVIIQNKAKFRFCINDLSSIWTGHFYLSRISFIRSTEVTSSLYFITKFLRDVRSLCYFIVLFEDQFNSRSEVLTLLWLWRLLFSRMWRRVVK
jgi:hypothetical protein